MEIKPLWYFGTPTRDQTEALREGKKLLDVAFLISPKPVVISQHFKTGELLVDDAAEGIAMAFEDPGYPYLDGYIDVSKTRTPVQFRNALAAVYLGEYSDFVITPEKRLHDALGPLTLIEEES